MTKVLAHFSVNGPGYPGELTRDEFLKLAQIVKDNDGIFVQATEMCDHRSWHFDYISLDDMAASVHLEISEEDRLFALSYYSDLKRKNKESASDWKDRIDAHIRYDGYIIRNGRPVWVCLIGIGHIPEVVDPFVRGSHLMIEGDENSYKIHAGPVPKTRKPKPEPGRHVKGKAK